MKRKFGFALPVGLIATFVVLLGVSGCGGEQAPPEIASDTPDDAAALADVQIPETVTGEPVHFDASSMEAAGKSMSAMVAQVDEASKKAMLETIDQYAATKLPEDVTDEEEVDKRLLEALKPFDGMTIQEMMKALRAAIAG